MLLSFAFIFCFYLLLLSFAFIFCFYLLLFIFCFLSLVFYLLLFIFLNSRFFLIRGVSVLPRQTPFSVTFAGC
ncbi:hypothetical protein DXD79_03015 [Hungatella hathewayi]|uniref:Uncharacterized protein n=1 Tax=Hungatella hathewayi TaxID=154046 RepID=A0A374PG38_9FIRM|nr:hypothetical protein DXD79_03015 [Hungatella hathewayi]